MIVFSKEKIEQYSTQIQDKISEEVDTFDPHAVAKYLAELSGFGGISSILVGSTRKLKDEDKKNTWMYEACTSLEKNLHYRLSSLNSIIGFLGKEVMAMR